jgi:uncharacterized protein with HEPN domain
LRTIVQDAEAIQEYVKQYDICNAIRNPETTAVIKKVLYIGSEGEILSY